MNDKIQYISIDKLRFDPENPRLPIARKGASEEAVISYMIRNENLFDLVGSIGEQGYFEGEPLIIVPLEDQNSFIVVEGNRRLAALKVLLDHSLIKERKATFKQIVESNKSDPPDTVPCIIFPSRQEIVDYLGYRHITGVDQWDAISKARFLSQLKDLHRPNFNNDEELYRHLAKIIGSRSDYVNKLIDGYHLFQEIEKNDFYDISGLNEEEFDFSVLTTAMSYKNIAQFINSDVADEMVVERHKNLEELTKYLFEHIEGAGKRIPESRDLKTFNMIVGNEAAFEAFRSGKSLTEAEIFTEGPEIAFTKLIRDAYRRMKSALEALHRIKEVNDEKYILDTLEDIKTINSDIQFLIKKRLSESDEQR